jgi:phospholipase/lecithinase/hemolysin
MSIGSWRSALAVLVVGPAFGLPGVASSASPPYPMIYSFGDSLSDGGNVYVLTGGIEPISPPYWRGHFSNGPVWVEDLAHAIGAHGGWPSLLGGPDFAYGGAETGETSVHTVDPVLDLPSQLVQFAADVPHPRAGALYTVWIGANDLFGILTSGLTPQQAEKPMSQAVNNVKTFVIGLGFLGAKQLLLVTVPDLGMVPSVTSEGAAASAAASAISASFDASLVPAVQSVARIFGMNVHVLDSFSLIDAAIADPHAYRFTNVTTACWTGPYTSLQGTLCSESLGLQDAHLFWDGVHPSARGHLEVAAAAEAALGLGAASLVGAGDNQTEGR